MITITEYGRLKTPKAKAPDQRFLLNPTNNARKNPKQSIYWYGCCPMGYKQVSKLLPKAIERACPEVDAKKMKITGNSWRKTTVQAGADAGVNGAMMSKILGHANLESKLAYMKESNEAHTAIGLSLNRTIMGKQNNNYQDVYRECKEAGFGGHSGEEAMPAPGPPMPVTDRPHTISSAYEKSHQRPPLQRVTFAPPDKAGTIYEEERVFTEDAAVSRPVVPQYAAVLRAPVAQYAEVSRPLVPQYTAALRPPVAQYVTVSRHPVPQHGFSLDQTNPSMPVPGKTAAAVLAKQSLAMAGPSPQQMSNFQCYQPDMGEWKICASLNVICHMYVKML